MLEWSGGLVEKAHSNQVRTLWGAFQSMLHSRMNGRRTQSDSVLERHHAIRRDRPQRRGRGARARAAGYEGGRVRQPGSGDAGDASGTARGARPTAEDPGLGDDGQTRVSYTAPAEIGARYALTDELAARLAGIDGLTDALVSA